MIDIHTKSTTLIQLLCLCLFSLAWSCTTAREPHSPDGEWKSIRERGMEVRWRFTEDQIELEMSAPTTGWLAIGFNGRSGLTGTNLIMGSVANGETTLSDQYVSRPGDHRPISEHGGKSWLQLVDGEETDSQTRIRFLLPRGQSDQWHHALTPGKNLYLLVAFSREDDFAHHSMMRTEVKIEL